MGITMTPAMWMLLDLIISNAIKVALQEVSQLTPEEITARTVVEEGRKTRLKTELYGG